MEPYHSIGSNWHTDNLVDSSYPANGSQKLIEVEDERKLRIFMEKRVRPMSPLHRNHIPRNR